MSKAGYWALYIVGGIIVYYILYRLYKNRQAANARLKGGTYICCRNYAGGTANPCNCLEWENSTQPCQNPCNAAAFINNNPLQARVVTVETNGPVGAGMH